MKEHPLLFTNMCGLFLYDFELTVAKETSHFSTFYANPHRGKWYVSLSKRNFYSPPSAYTFQYVPSISTFYQKKFNFQDNSYLQQKTTCKKNPNL